MNLKVLFDSHHRMERFCVLFVFFVTTLFALLGISLGITHNQGKITLTTQAKYTQTAQWSLTGQTVNVVDVYRNDASSRIFILLKIGQDADDMATMSLNAEDYIILMTGRGREKLTNTPKAAVYMFGNTGYMGLYFVDAKGFDPHVYDIVVRNTNMVVPDVADETRAAALEAFGDRSYATFNQMHLYANFAGTDAVVKDFLNTDNPSVEMIYADTVAAIDEGPARKQLDQCLYDMNNYMVLINNYAKNLSSQGVRIPELPAALKGDAIVTDPSLTASNPSGFDKSMLSQADVLVSSGYTRSSDGYDEFQCVSGKTDDTGTGDGSLYLVTDFVFPGGVQYDYQSRKLVDGFLDDLKPSDMTFRQWTESKSVEKSTYQSVTGRIDNSYYAVWETSDGIEFSSSDSVFLEENPIIKDNITRYIDAVNQLYQAKYNYQVTSLYSLLRIQSTSDMSGSMFSIRNDDDTLIVY